MYDFNAPFKHPLILSVRLELLEHFYYTFVLHCTGRKHEGKRFVVPRAPSKRPYNRLSGPTGKEICQRSLCGLLIVDLLLLCNMDAPFQLGRQSEMTARPWISQDFHRGR